MRQKLRGLTVGLTLMTLAAGPVTAAQGDGQGIAQPGSVQTASQPDGQSVVQPGTGSQIVSQPGQCVAQGGTGQGVTQGSQAVAPGGAGVGGCTAAVAPLPIALGGHLTHSKILRSGRRQAAANHRHKTH